jgi:hypothetical protein
MRQNELKQFWTFDERPGDKAAANTHFLRLAELAL